MKRRNKLIEDLSCVLRTQDKSCSDNNQVLNGQLSINFLDPKSCTNAGFLFVRHLP